MNHAPGRVRLTVAGQYYSFSSQWLVTDCLCYTPKLTKETNIKAQHVPDPQHHTFLSSPSSWLLIFTQSDQGYIFTSYLTRFKWHLLVVVRWFVSAPHVWWWCHKLHDEVNQTLLKVRSCPLLEEDKTATSTLRGWLEGWGSAGGGRAIRANSRGNTGIWIFSDRHLINTKSHDTAHWGQEKAREWEGLVRSSRIISHESCCHPPNKTSYSGERSGGHTTENCLPKLQNPTVQWTTDVSPLQFDTSKAKSGSTWRAQRNKQPDTQSLKTGRATQHLYVLVPTKISRYIE